MFNKKLKQENKELKEHLNWLEDKLGVMAICSKCGKPIYCRLDDIEISKDKQRTFHSECYKKGSDE